MPAIQRHRIVSLAHTVALGLALAVSACSKRAPEPPPEPMAPVAAPVLGLAYAIEVTAVDSDADLGDLNAMISQALVEGGYAIAERSADADVVLKASLVATRVNSGMVVVVNGVERVQRDITLTLLAQPAGGDGVVDQTTRSFSTKEPRIPPGEVARAVNALGAGGKLDTFAEELVANAAAAEKAKADAEAAAAEEAAKAEALAAKTRGCDQLDVKTAESYVKRYRGQEEVSLKAAARIYNPEHKWCDVEETTKSLGMLADAPGNAPKSSSGKASPRLTELAKRELVRADIEGVTFVRAAATEKKKNLVNQYGLSMGTTRRIAILTRVAGGAACFEVRGDWRMSKMHEDRDEPEFIKLDWANGGPAAYLVACPKR